MQCYLVLSGSENEDQFWEEGEGVVVEESFPELLKY